MTLKDRPSQLHLTTSCKLPVINALRSLERRHPYESIVDKGDTGTRSRDIATTLDVWMAEWIDVN